jgi:hypothetical protein
MKARQVIGAASVVGVCVVTVLAGALLLAPRLQAADDREGDEAKVRRGFEVAPVPLNLAGKNRALVGLGSYMVNVQSECNGCHSAGPQTQFLQGGNPYMGQPEQVNTATYLGGGRDFGAFPTPVSTLHIYSRNLTPDHTGLPIGGDTFETFVHTIRTGIDPDGLHPNIPLGFRGDLLQIMPWPAYQNFTDRDLRAIYEYLSAIPCVASTGHVC